MKKRPLTKSLTTIFLGFTAMLGCFTVLNANAESYSSMSNESIIVSTEQSSYPLSVTFGSTSTNVTKLSSSVISTDWQDDGYCKQIPSSTNGGVYFLNGKTLKLYTLSSKSVKTVNTFDAINDFAFYATTNYLYVISDQTSSKIEITKYNLNTQKVSSTISISKSGITFSRIGVDNSGRIYLYGLKDSDDTDYIYLYSSSGTKLSSASISGAVYEFVGFDSTNGNFYYDGYTNWVYWGYDHDMSSVRCGNVTSNKLTVSSNYLELIYQKYWYYHQTGAELLNNKYLVISNMVEGTTDIINSNKFDITGTTYDQALSVYVSSINDGSISDADGEYKVGTRTIIHPSYKTAIMYVTGNTLCEFNISSNKLINEYATAHPVFSLITYNGNEIIALEREGDNFYLERIDWTYPSKVTLSASSKNVKVGKNLQLTATVDSDLDSNLTWSSSNKKVASVNQSGKVTGVSTGTAKITAKTSDGVKGTFTVTVKSNSSIKSATKKITTTGTKSTNVSNNNYTTYGNTVNSYLAQESDGTLTRVEYISGKVIVENYSSNGKKRNYKKTISNPLSIFGGFYSGSNYNYLVFGQNNTSESDSKEVIRVVKYTKSWSKVKSVSIKGANTYIPFDAGSLRMTETNGVLYIHTCHEMYASGGVHHQANMTFVIKESNMTVSDSYYDVMNIAQAGYVSHSFNQFVQTDGDYVYRVDHGDAYPRSVTIIKSAVGGDITSVSYKEAFTYTQEFNSSNYTGASVGGFELSDNSCIIVGNDQGKNTKYVRNIFVSITDKLLNSSETIYLTKYTNSSSLTAATPQMVKISDNQFLVMWEEYNTSTDKYVDTKMVVIDDEGHKLTSIVRTIIRLSDCQPIMCSDSNVRWYKTSNSSPIIYAINPYKLSSYEFKLSKVSNLTSNSATKSITLKWDKVTSAQGYRIYEYNSSTKKWTKVATVKSGSTTSYKVTGLSTAKKYKFRIRAYRKFGSTIKWGSYSSTLTTSTKPTQVKISSASKSKTAVRLNWNKVTRATGYQIQRYDASAKKWVAVKTIKNGSTLTYRDTGLKSNKVYKYRVRAYKTLNGNKYYGKWSVTKTVTTKS
ncbi:MAG: Ig-like domain-containing protein [Ruminococcus sp.]|nr:Ig-like domain-containing protein [Ruminococcus sp.]